MSDERIDQRQQEIAMAIVTKLCPDLHQNARLDLATSIEPELRRFIQLELERYTEQVFEGSSHERR